MNGTVTLWVPLGRRALPTASEGLSVIASPCIEIQTCMDPRAGKGDKFKNLDIKKLHDISNKVVRKTKLSIHENVTTFEEETLTKSKCTKRVSHTALRPGFLPGEGNGLSDPESNVPQLY